MRLTSIFTCVFITFIFSGCEKSDEPQTLPENTEVSGKIRTITNTVPGTGIATIYNFDYDNTGRVISYKYLINDSSASQMTVSSRYFTFAYNGTDPKPVSSTFTDHTNSFSDVTAYTYNLQNRIIKEELYRNGIIAIQNEYSYYTKSFARTTLYNISGVLQPVATDTVWTDNNGNQLKMNMYYFDPSIAPRSAVLTYDNKKNPLGETNIGLFVKTFYADDRAQFLFSPNNLKSQTGNIDGVDMQTGMAYLYSSNHYPITAWGENGEVYTFQYH